MPLQALLGFVQPLSEVFECKLETPCKAPKNAIKPYDLILSYNTSTTTNFFTVLSQNLN